MIYRVACICGVRNAYRRAAWTRAGVSPRRMDGAREYRRAAWIYRTVLQLFCCRTFELSPAVSYLWNEN